MVQEKATHTINTLEGTNNDMGYMHIELCRDKRVDRMQNRAKQSKEPVGGYVNEYLQVCAWAPKRRAAWAHAGQWPGNDDSKGRKGWEVCVYILGHSTVNDGSVPNNHFVVFQEKQLSPGLVAERFLERLHRPNPIQDENRRRMREELR